MISRNFPSYYINVTVGLILCQMSISHCLYFLIQLQIVFCDKFRIHIVASQQFPKSLRSLKHSVLNRYITAGIDHYRRIAYHKYNTILTDAILRVEKASLLHVGHQVGTSYRTDIFPTILTGLILNEINIFNLIIFVFIVIFRNTFYFAGSYLNFLIGGGVVGGGGGGGGEHC